MARRPTVCLNMIVRNEAHVIAETLDCVAPLVDCWVIVDTGSTDETRELIDGYFAGRGIPGELHERPWRDFGSNRTEALELSRGKADYTWVMDADDLVVGEIDFGGLTEDSYLLRYGEGFRYWRKMLLRSALPWRFEGVLHEYAECDEPAGEARLEGDYHIESRRLGDRSRASDKYERDCRVLLDALERDPDNPRSVFYLAQSYRDAGDDRRALEWYERRAAMDGWDEETFYSLLQRAACLHRLGEPWPAQLGAYLEAWQARPQRAEPLFHVAEHYERTRQFELAYLFAGEAARIPLPEDDILFVDADIHEWRSTDLRAIAAHYTGRHREAFELSTALLEGEALPEPERPRLDANRDFAAEEIMDEELAYPTDTVRALTRRRPSAKPGVTLTITSCRRPELFGQTVDSFLNCCEDVESITRWVCIDDGSSGAQRTWMQEAYPFFEFVLKDRSEKGHARSMNTLRELVDTPYWLHLEDDWHFFARLPYVRRAIAILEDDPGLAQVLFNRCYGETLACREIAGGEVARTAREGLRYLRHTHDAPGRDPHPLPPGAVSNNWWPHFSLQPSLMRTDAVRGVGAFDPLADHFELDFAHRYTAAGLTSAYFDAINCLHIGRLRSESADPHARPNAYDLNDESQFGRPPPGTRSAAAEPGRDLSAPSPAPEAEAPLDVRVINLERRPDRLATFLGQLHEHAGPGLASRFRRLDAVDGRGLELTDEIRHLFRGNRFGFRRGVVAAALSHLRLWEEVASAGRGVCLVFEDDAVIGEGFPEGLAAARAAAARLDPCWDVVLLGYISPQDAPPPDAGCGGASLVPARWSRFVGGTFCYLISPSGARRLLDLAARDGIQVAIDTFLKAKRVEISVLECVRPLATSPWVSTWSDGDSDIQHDFVPVRGHGGDDGVPGIQDLVAAVGLGEIRLDLPEGWRPRRARIAPRGDAFRVDVSVETPQGPGTLLVLLSSEVEVEAVEASEGGGADGQAGIPTVAHVTGATPCIPVPDGSLCAVDVREGDTPAHRLVRLGAEGAVEALSPPFTLDAGGTETRCGGIVLGDGDLLLSYTSEGGRIGLAVMDAGEALALLRPCR